MNSVAFVAIKMGRRQGARSGAYLRSIRNRRATQPPGHFHRNPPGRGQLAVFPRCSLLTYQSRYARRSRLEKQPTDLRRKACYFGDRTLGWQKSFHSQKRLPNWFTMAITLPAKGSLFLSSRRRHTRLSDSGKRV